jgi:hypothetical protein
MPCDRVVNSGLGALDQRECPSLRRSSRQRYYIEDF